LAWPKLYILKFRVRLSSVVYWKRIVSWLCAYTRVPASVTAIELYVGYGHVVPDPFLFTHSHLQECTNPGWLNVVRWRIIYVDHLFGTGFTSHVWPLKFWFGYFFFFVKFIHSCPSYNYVLHYSLKTVIKYAFFGAVTLWFCSSLCHIPLIYVTE